MDDPALQNYHAWACVYGCTERCVSAVDGQRTGTHQYCQDLTATPRLMASEQGHLNIVKILLQHHVWWPANRDTSILSRSYCNTTFDGQWTGTPQHCQDLTATPRLMASEQGHLNIVKILLQHHVWWPANKDTSILSRSYCNTTFDGQWTRTPQYCQDLTATPRSRWRLWWGQLVTSLLLLTYSYKYVMSRWDDMQQREPCPRYNVCP